MPAPASIANTTVYRVFLMSSELLPDWYGRSPRLATIPSSPLAQACWNTPSGDARKLEFVIRRLDSFKAEVDLQLAAVMSGVREVCPEPFKTSHLAVWWPYNGVQLLRCDPFNDLIAEIE